MGGASGELFTRCALSVANHGLEFLPAYTVLAQSRIAVRMTWEALHRGLNLTLEESALLGADYFGLVAATSDFREGTWAFIEKRSPAFTGS